MRFSTLTYGHIILPADRHVAPKHMRTSELIGALLGVLFLGIFCLLVIDNMANGLDGPFRAPAAECLFIRPMVDPGQAHG